MCVVSAGLVFLLTFRPGDREFGFFENALLLYRLYGLYVKYLYGKY